MIGPIFALNGAMPLFNALFGRGVYSYIRDEEFGLETSLCRMM